MAVNNDPDIANWLNAKLKTKGLINLIASRELFKILKDENGMKNLYGTLIIVF